MHGFEWSRSRAQHGVAQAACPAAALLARRIEPPLGGAGGHEQQLLEEVDDELPPCLEDCSLAVDGGHDELLGNEMPHPEVDLARPRRSSLRALSRSPATWLRTLKCQQLPLPSTLTFVRLRSCRACFMVATAACGGTVILHQALGDEEEADPAVVTPAIVNRGGRDPE